MLLEQGQTGECIPQMLAATFQVVLAKSAQQTEQDHINDESIGINSRLTTEALIIATPAALKAV